MRRDQVSLGTHFGKTRRGIGIAASAIALAWAGGAALGVSWAWHRWLDHVMLTGSRLVILGAWPAAALLIAAGLVFLSLGRALPRLDDAARSILRLGGLALAAPPVMLAVMFIVFGFYMDRPAFLASLCTGLLALCVEKSLSSRTSGRRLIRRLIIAAALIAVAIPAMFAIAAAIGGRVPFDILLRAHLLPLNIPAAYALTGTFLLARRRGRAYEPKKTGRFLASARLLLLPGLAAELALTAWCCNMLATALDMREVIGEVMPGVYRISDRPDGFWIETEPGGGILATYNRTGIIARFDEDGRDLQLGQIPDGHLQHFAIDRDAGLVYVANHDRPAGQVVIMNLWSLRPAGSLDTGCRKTSELAIDPARRRLLATCEDRPSLAVYDLGGLQRIDTLRLSGRGGQYAVRIGSGRQSSRVWTADSFDGYVRRLDRQSLEQVAKGFAGFLAFSALPDEGRGVIWISLPLRSQVLGLDMETLRPRIKLDVGCGARFLALHPTKPVLFVAEYFSGELRAVDLDRRKTIWAIPLGPMMRGVAVSQDGDELYAVSMFGTFRVDLTRGLRKI